MHKYKCFLFFFLHKVTFTKIDENQDKRNIPTKRPTSSERGNTTIIFSLKNEVGSLVEALKVFQVGVKLKF